MILLICVAALAGYVLWSLVCMELNYQRAKSMGVPLVRLPIDVLNVPWQVFEGIFWHITELLHIPLPKYPFRYMRRGWHFKYATAAHLELGPVFAFVTPQQILVQLSDPEAITQVVTNRQQFPRPAKNYEVLAVFGPSVSTAAPEDWARHRKVLAPPFMNEAIMRSVWDESIRQARQMIHSWSSQGIASAADDTRSVSLNVLAAIGFRRSFDFKSSSAEPSTVGKDGRFSYRDALQIVLDKAILILMIPRKHLRYSWLPASIQRAGKAAEDFAIHMQEMVDSEMVMLNQGNKGSGSLITAFVKALDVHQKDRTKGMSVEEILGNLFVINFAGHDTTANTLAFATLFLAAYPQVQEWVADEVKRVLKDIEEDSWDYSALFPELVRCRAVMLETLRLFPPIMSLPKTTNPQPQTIKVGTQSITIPSDTTILSNVLAVQTHPEFWTSPKDWTPARWIVTDPSGCESLVTPRRNTYMAWSDGPQNCPGLKFSQVEFVAVMACLLHRHRVDGIREEGEGVVEMTKRVRGVIDDCNQEILLKMNDPDRVKVALKTK